MRALRRSWWWLPVAALAAACASPEAQRARGGGPGADPGNRGPTTRVHAGAEMYYRTPCRTEKVECSGPMPEFGVRGT